MPLWYTYLYMQILHFRILTTFTIVTPIRPRSAWFVQKRDSCQRNLSSTRIKSPQIDTNWMEACTYSWLMWALGLPTATHLIEKNRYGRQDTGGRGAMKPAQKHAMKHAMTGHATACAWPLGSFMQGLLQLLGKCVGPKLSLNFTLGPRRPGEFYYIQCTPFPSRPRCCLCSLIEI